MASAMDLATLRQKGSTVGSHYTITQKLMFGAIALVLIGGGYAFTKWASQPTYQTLFSNLAPEDASSITTKLASEGVSYKLVDGGQRVMVPQNKVYQLRVDMSAAGLPAGGNSGYNLLDKQGLTTSEFRQRVDYQRALQGELGKTVSAIDGVESASINLVIPKDDLFSSDSKKPTASVLIKTSSGSSISANQAKTIVHLVSSAVEGLQPGDVTVADQTGRILSTDANDTFGLSDSHSKAKAEFEQQLSNTIEEQLWPITGQGKAIVNISADIDFDKRQTQTERFDQPNTSPVQSERIVTETYGGNGSTTSGVLGGATTIPAGAINGSGYASSETTREYMTGKVTEVVESAPGSIRKLSVAVLLDGNVENLDKNAIQRLVSSSVGFDATRGDKLSVEALKFDTKAQEEADKVAKTQQAAAKQEQLISMVRNGVIIVVVIVALFLLLRTIKKTIANAPRPIALPRGSDDDSMSLTAGQVAALTAGLSASPGSLDAKTMAQLSNSKLPASNLVPTPEMLERQQRNSDVSALIDRQPAEVAALLRSWLSDRRG